jgi:hypothetical protein
VKGQVWIEDEKSERSYEARTAEALLDEAHLLRSDLRGLIARPD